jgi:hypothetical protein
MSVNEVFQPILNTICPAEEYFAVQALSFSGMKDLAVSPLRFWHLHINPDKPERKETAEMRFGSALHCLVLEGPEAFWARYCRELDADEIEGCLVTMDDLRQFIRDKGHKPVGGRKIDLIQQTLSIDPHAKIFDVLAAVDEDANKGKVRLSKDDWLRVHRASDALLDEPALHPILHDDNGESEVPLFVRDPNTGANLKAKLDWVTPSITLDIKTFSQQRGKSIDRCVHDAIYYEHYNWQAYLYTTIRAIHGDHKPRYVMAFVESDEPYEVRLKELRPTRGEPCLYWVKAEMEVKRLITLYADCVKRFGNKPWRTEREIEILLDDDIPQSAFSSWA